MSITLDITKGLYTGVKVESDQLVLLPESVCPLFPGDDSEWTLKQSAAAWTTVNTDRLQNVNTDDTYLQATISIEQGAALEITFRVKVSGEGLSGGEDASRFGIRLRGYDVNGISGGNLLGSAEEAFPMGSWNEQQFEVSFTPSAAVHWLYAYVFARNQDGTITVRDAEIWDSAQTDRQYGVWHSPSIDRRQTTTVTSGADTGLNPRLMGFYYSHLYTLDRLDSVLHGVDILGDTDDVVIEEPGRSQFTTGDVRADRALAVMRALVASGMRVWGYTYCSGNRDLQDFYDEIDRCAAEDYYGMFIDEAGWSDTRPDMTRAKFNTIVDYAHDAGLKCFVNSTDPDDVLSPDVDATYNPDGLATSLGDGDWILFESFWTRSDDYYSGDPAAGSWDFAQYAERWANGLVDAHALGVNAAALSFPLTATELDDYDDWNNAYLAAIAFGIDGWHGSGTSSQGEGSPGRYRSWPGRPDIKAGDTLVSSIVLDDVANGVWLAETDQGLLEFTILNSPTVVREASIGIFTGNLTALADETVEASAGRVTYTWEVRDSKDDGWEELSDDNIYYKYARRKVELWS